MKRILIVTMLVSSIIFSQTTLVGANQNVNDEQAVLQAQTNNQIESNAGSWRTWVISSGKDYRVPPPPRRRETRAELKRLAELISQNDEHVRQQITFWDAGAPAYRWIDLINSRLLAAPGGQA